MSEEYLPDNKGRFGVYGGRYVAETLVPALDELSEQYQLIKNDKDFLEEFRNDLSHYVGRPSPLYFAKLVDSIIRWGKGLSKKRRSKSYGSP